MGSIEFTDPALARIQRLAARVRTNERGAVLRAIRLMEYLLDAQEAGQKTTLTDTDGTIRKLVIAHASDGYLSIHDDRIVL